MVNSAVGRAALVLLGVLTLGACAPSTSVPKTPSPSASTTSSTTPSLDFSGTKKDAADKVVAYRALIDELRQQYKPDSSKLATLARGSAYDSWTYTLQDDFVKGHRQTGTASVAIISVGSGPTAADWNVTGCVDYSAVDIVDKNGKSVMTAAPGKDLTLFTVTQDQNNKKWYVTTDEVKGKC